MSEPPVIPQPIEAIPVAPLPYATPALQRRSARLQFVAILSLCVAGFSLLASGVWAYTSIGNIRSAQASGRSLSIEIAAHKQAIAVQQARRIALGSAAFAPLTPAQVSALVKRIETRIGSALPAQLNVALRQQFLAADQRLIVPSVAETDAPESWDPQLKQVRLLSDGSLRIVTSHESALRLQADGRTFYRTTLLPSGQLVIQNIWGQMTPAAVDPSATLSPAVAITVRLQHRAELSTIQAALNLLLAGFLIAAAVVLFRNSRRGVEMHWKYVIAKLTVNLSAIAIALWMGNPDSNSPALPDTALMGVLGCAYPLVLIPLLRAIQQV